MEEKALKELVALITAAHNNQTGVLDTGFIPAIALPEGSQILSLEQYQEHPSHFKNAYSADTLQEYLNYGNDHSRENMVTYVSVKESKAVTRFDQGTPEAPEWGHHTADLELKRLMGYKVFENSHGNLFSQDQFIDFFQDWSELIGFVSGSLDNMITMSFTQGITALSKVDVKKIKDASAELSHFKTTDSLLESVEVSSTDDTMPTYFSVSLTPYQGFYPVTLQCKVLATVGSNDKLSFSYRIMSQELLKEKLMEEFKSKIVEGLSGSKVYLGVAA